MPRRSELAFAVDRIRCDGYGLCAEMLPELISLDDWGYPILRRGAIHDDLEVLARRTVEACPVLALRIVQREASASSTDSRHTGGGARTGARLVETGTRQRPFVRG